MKLHVVGENSTMHPYNVESLSLALQRPGAGAKKNRTRS